MLTQPAVSARIVEVALQIAHAVGKPAPGGLVDVVGLEFATVGDESFHRIGEVPAPFLRSLGGQVDADELESVGQPLCIDQIVERRHDQALGQVAGGAEDHHDAGRRYYGTVGLRPALGTCQLILIAFHPRFVCGFTPDRIAGVRHLHSSNSFAAATTRSGSKPNLRCSSLSGADAPKVFMPMTWPAAPT